MEIDNSFDVPLAPPQAWAWLLDIERIATCLPGAELTEVVDAQTYKGRVGVRLGPVALSFVGQAKLEQTDPAQHKARMRATGADAKGRGSTSAVIDFALVPIGDGGSTRVNIHSNVTLTGSVAQYGRGAGMIQSVAEQIIGQFGECLRSRIQASAVAQPAPGASDGQAMHPAVSGAVDATGQALPAAAPQGAAAALPARPISGFALLARALLASLRRLFGAKPPA